MKDKGEFKHFTLDQMQPFHAIISWNSMLKKKKKKDACRNKQNWSLRRGYAEQLRKSMAVIDLQKMWIQDLFCLL